jgi:hypothetical protein
MPSTEWTIVELRGPDALQQVQGEWQRLYRQMPQRAVYHSYEAHCAYLAHLSSDPDRFRLVMLADTHGVRAICPLETRTERVLGVPMRVLALPLHPHWVLTDIICPEDDARRRVVPALTRHLRRASDGASLLTLGPLPQSSVIWDGLRELRGWRYYARLARPSDVFDCTKTYDELMARLSKHFRRNLRAAGRKLGELGDVRRVTAGNVSDLLAEFDSFMEVEQSGWKGRSGTGSAIALHPELISFYRDLAEGLGVNGACEINTLYADGRCLAAQFCVRTGEEYAILKIGYDQEYGRVAPGLMLLQDSLQRCCADPVVKRLSLVTDGPWQRDWHPDALPMVQAHVGIGHLRGQPSLEVMRFRHESAPRLAHRLRGLRGHFSSKDAAGRGDARDVSGDHPAAAAEPDRLMTSVPTTRR